MSNTQPPCQGSFHYFGPPTGLHGGQVCTCGERYGETIDGKFRMHVTAAGAESSAGEVACTPGARYESPSDHAAPICCGQPMRATGMGTWLGRPAWICSKCEVYQGPYGARTPAQWWRPAGMGPSWHWAQGTTYEAPTKAFPSQPPWDDLRERLGLPPAPSPLPIDLVERGRALAAKIMAHDTGGIPIARAPAPEQIPAIRAHLDEIRRSPNRLLMIDADALHEAAERLRAERRDGFDQRAVDAAKVVLLAQVPRRGKQ